MALVREDKSCVAMLTSKLANLQVEFNRLAKSAQRAARLHSGQLLVPLAQLARFDAFPNHRQDAHQ